MASSVGPVRGSERGSDRAAMERFGDMALLPWTKQILCVLWEQLRLLVHVIYYSFMSVFQMFRLEVHLRITDETGQHVQHMTSAANPESFLFSSLFDGDNTVMVGGSSPPGSSHAGALLSTLRAEELCCGLVDDFVSRATDRFPTNEEGLCLGHHPSWKLGFPGDWNIFLTSSDSSGTDEACYKSAENVFESKLDPFGEEKDHLWCKDADQSPTAEEFDSEDSKALWESLSRSSDPYNPFFFSACISSTSSMGKAEKDKREPECVSPSKATEDFQGPQAPGFWASRSDSENSCSSWGSSDGSCADLDREESERLWELFSSPADPYNPLCFTACAITTATQPEKAPAPPLKTTGATPPQLAPQSDTDTEERESSSTEEDEERLWRSLSLDDDPYHPLNFRACLQSSPAAAADTPKCYPGGEPETSPAPLAARAAETETVAAVARVIRSTKPVLSARRLTKHRHPASVVVPWRRPENTAPPAGGVKEGKDGTAQKKVQFSPLVQVHVMRTWPFARQASRKGCWEELARDRDRFRRRIQETEDAIGYCFSCSHREKILAYLDGTSKSSNTLN